MANPYGYELILDLEGCGEDIKMKGVLFPLFFRRRFLKGFFKSLCRAIRMEPQKLCFWDDMFVLPWNRSNKPHTKGTTAVQFIITSNITVHYLELTDSALINIFSCKSFDRKRAEELVQTWFKPKVMRSHLIRRLEA